TAVAVPLSTLVPRKQVFVSSSGEMLARASEASNFSTGIDSPVRVAWVRKRSLEEMIRTSAGIMSPAERDFDRGGLADHRGGDVDHGLEFGGGGIGLGLLDETEADAEGDHEQHDRAGARIAGGVGDGGQGAEKDDERIARGVEQADEPALLALGGDFIGAVLFQPFLGGFGGEAIG